MPNGTDKFSYDWKDLHYKDPIKERIWQGIIAPDTDSDDLINIISAALAIERKLYAKEELGDSLFRLRKSLEGIWGHDLPEVE